MVVDYLEHDVEAALRSEAAIVGAVGLIGLFGTAESLDYLAISLSRRTAPCRSRLGTTSGLRAAFAAAGEFAN